MVHCSDGWDRTSQLSALMQILVDPYYRTVQGFEVVVEKEFVCPGHQFAHRLACGTENALDYSEFCPVFLQFLDCVWQVMEQFPTGFEFNELFLREIAHHSFAARFGTFLCNCEKQRADVDLRARTTSLWAHLNAQADRFRNVLFSDSASVLVPDETVRRLKVWEGVYMQWNVKEPEGKKLMDEFIRQKLEKERESELKLKEKEEELGKLIEVAKQQGIELIE